MVATTDHRYGSRVKALVLHFFVFTVARGIHRDRQDVIEYLREENRVLREQLGKKHLRLTDDQRHRLAVRAKALGRAALQGLASIVTPDTLLAWYRKLVAAKYNGTPQHGPGRPPTASRIAELVVRMAKENPTWDGCLRRLIPLGERHLRRIISEYVEHYHRERNHQGLDNQLIMAPAANENSTGTAQCRERLGGTLRFYYRDAA